MLKNRIDSLKRKLQHARFGAILYDDEFEDVLRNATYIATRSVRHMSTNGEYVYFDPDWLGKLSEEELCFMLCHQAMHILLGHIQRSTFYSGERFHLACDIVVNSNLFYYGWTANCIKHCGKIYTETFFPVLEGKKITPYTALKAIPFDPAVKRKPNSLPYTADSDAFWGKPNVLDIHDTIVLTPQDIDPDNMGTIIPLKGPHRIVKEYENWIKYYNYSEEPGESPTDLPMLQNWEAAANNIIEELSRKRDSGDRTEYAGGDVERRIRYLDAKTLDWRYLLQSFIQENIKDYSFVPPDRRLDELNIFLPDFNVPEDTVKNVLFAVDTSASVSADLLGVAFDEISSAIEQFGGRLCGRITFFDSSMYKPIEFESVDDVNAIRPKGGGGTNIRCVFQYLEGEGQDNRPSSLIVFTDGNLDYPRDEEMLNIPVLWLIPKTAQNLPAAGSFVFL